MKWIKYIKRLTKRVTDEEKLINEIFNIGFIDVTEEKPISFIEMFGETFSTLYGYSHRFVKEEGDFRYQLLLAVEFKRIDIEGIVVHPFGIQKFHLNGPLKLYYIVIQQTKQLIEIIKERAYDRQRNIQG